MSLYSSSLLLVFIAAPLQAAPYDLRVRIIKASNSGLGVDPKLADLAKELEPLKFTSLSLADEALFKVELGASGRMQLPSKEWMTIKADSLGADGKLRLVIEVQKLEFRAVVGADVGATVAVRGPDYQGSTLILAVTRGATSK